MIARNLDRQQRSCASSRVRFGRTISKFAERLRRRSVPHSRICAAPASSRAAQSMPEREPAKSDALPPCRRSHFSIGERIDANCCLYILMYSSNTKCITDAKL